MFTRVSNASKVAFAALVDFTKDHDFVVIDCQVSNPHLESLGAREIPRKDFLKLVDEGLRMETIKGNWPRS
jgi:leucyl/phenylalanyl-tRNA--protein transferase